MTAEPTTTRARSLDEPGVVDELLAAVAGGESVRQACEDRGVQRWKLYERIAKDEPLRTRYELALETRAEVLAEEIVDIADEDARLVELKDNEGNVVDFKVDTAFEAWRKTRIDARKWTASRLLPKRYGDKLELGGEVKGGPLVVVNDWTGRKPEAPRAA